MKIEVFLGRTLGEWVIPGVIGGDQPGVPEPSLEAHEKYQEIQQEIANERSRGLIPFGKKRGVYASGPIEGPDGVKRTVVYKIEYIG